ncbi:MAG: PD-(D/E)XK nuclease family protein [Oscillospiraceae bacterium]|nr:PD-(D/E)XK nuclease family protein [Oscillospiraceae bacterium]
MLQLLLGRGRRSLPRLLEKIKSDGKAGRPVILIVPEQYSHQMERTLCEVVGNESCLFAEVLSFTRLASRVEALAGGLAVSPLDNGGRILMMQRARARMESELSFYARSSAKPVFLKGLLSTIDELKSGLITPELLYHTAEQAEGDQRQRLQELALLYGAYDSLLGRTCCDPKDRLTRLAEQLETSAYGKGKSVCFYGFTDFTAQEKQVVRALFSQALSVTAVLPCSSLEGKEEHFAFARQTGQFLLRLAKQQDRRAEVIVCRAEAGERTPELLYLEQMLFTAPWEPMEEIPPRNTVICREAQTIFSEVAWAAAEILHLVEETGCRFRDIGVVARGFETYARWVDVVFARYGIPVFLSQMTDILEKPVISLVVAALDILEYGYEKEDVLRYLKTGLTHLTIEECDLLENYILCWEIRGKQFQTQWTMHPGGFGQEMTPEDEKTLDRLNLLREKFLAPLKRLGGKRARTAREQALALYGFLEEIQLPQRLEQRSALLEEQNQKELAEEYRQLWEILCHGLEQCVEYLDDTAFTLQEFSALFSLVLSQYHVGSIPISMDRVTAGEAMRIGQQPVRYLLILGAAEEAVPSLEEPPGMLKEEDRVLLEGAGLLLSSTEEYRLLREMATIDAICAMPSDGLYLSYPMQGPGGQQQRPSFLFPRIRRLLPCAPFQREADHMEEICMAAPYPALESVSLDPQNNDAWLTQLSAAFPEYAPAVAAVRRAAAAQMSPLSPQVVRALYDDRISMSASRLDRHQSCRFSYFMQYGLKAKPRRRAKFQAPEMGSLIHFVLEQVLIRGQKGNGVREMGPEDWKPVCKAAMAQYAETVLGGLDQKSPRFDYLFHRLEKTVFLIVENVMEELRASDFTPLSFELGFGPQASLPPIQIKVDGVTLSISGFVDRVDGWEQDGTLYLRIVDYKTGYRSFDLTEIWNGLGMQILLYLFALEKEGGRLYGRPVQPAGVLYLPARQVVISGSHNMTEQLRRSKVDAALRRRGLLLNSPQVLEAMEHCKETGVRFLPIRVSAKTGQFSGDALVTAAQLEGLNRHLNRILHALAKELTGGEIAPNPWYRGPKQQACTFCPFASACQFDPVCGHRKRYFKKQKPENFWQQILSTDQPE